MHARRYPHGVEWAEDRHWRCNNNAHPSRHGTYDGISMHPFETVRAPDWPSNPTLRLVVDWLPCCYGVPRPGPDCSLASSGGNKRSSRLQEY